MEQKIFNAINNFYVVVMIAVTPLFIWLNWDAQEMAGLLGGYQAFAVFIKSGFSIDTFNLTFPMWGYGFLMAVSENKLFLLLFQNCFALLTLYYAINILEKETLLPGIIITFLKMILVGYIPWYTFHSLRWPYSIGSSLLLLSIIVLYQAVKYTDYGKLLVSGICFGLMLNFRSDYWLMPFGIAALLIVQQRKFLASFLWLSIIVICLLPWAFYTQSVTGHYELTSTNAGHVCFIGLGNDKHNPWGIQESDGDPLMHQLVDAQFKKQHHSTLNYSADQFLKQTFFEYIQNNPQAYLKKCFVAFIRMATQGTYRGEFSSQLWWLQKIASLQSKLLVFCGLLILPITAYCAIATGNLFFSLVAAVISYQLLLNSFCYHMPSYTTNSMVFLLLNVLYFLTILIM